MAGDDVQACLALKLLIVLWSVVIVMSSYSVIIISTRNGPRRLVQEKALRTKWVLGNLSQETRQERSKDSPHLLVVS